MALAAGGFPPESPQTVASVELFAAVHLVRHVSVDADVVIGVYIGRKCVVDGLHALARGWRLGPWTKHGYLWARVAGDAVAMAAFAGARIAVCKMKLHLSPANAVAAGFGPGAWAASDLADHLAVQLFPLGALRVWTN